MFKMLMNYFLSLAEKRESVRRYQDKEVEREKITKIIEACRISPSACNSQPWKFVVVDEPELKNRLAKTTYDFVAQFNRFVPRAPVIVALVIERPTWFANIGGKMKEKDFSFIDNGIVASYFCLQAAELGLGTCMLGWFNEKKAKKMLNIPENKRISLLITLGYPAKDNRKKIRKSLNEIYSYNSYQ